MGGGAWSAAVHGVAKSWHDWVTSFAFHFHALEKAIAPHSSILALRIPETEESSGLPSVGSHIVGHDWSDWLKQLSSSSSNLLHQLGPSFTLPQRDIIYLAHVCLAHMIHSAVKVCWLKDRNCPFFFGSYSYCPYFRLEFSFFSGTNLSSAVLAIGTAIGEKTRGLKIIPIRERGNWRDLWKIRVLHTRWYS